MRTLLLLLLLLVVACSSGIRIDESNTEVEIDVFSGLPNPRWQLTREEARELQRKLNDLPRDSGALRETLGYRGFVIKNANQRIHISNGLVALERGDEQVFFRDAHGAEEWLLENAARRGYQRLLRR